MMKRQASQLSSGESLSEDNSDGTTESADTIEADDNEADIRTLIKRQTSQLSSEDGVSEKPVDETISSEDDIEAFDAAEEDDIDMEERDISPKCEDSAPSELLQLP